MLLVLLLVVFSSVFIAFNVFINNYIYSNVKEQLDDVVQSYVQFKDRNWDKPPNEFLPPPNPGDKKSKIGAPGEVILLNSDYQIVSYNEFSINESLEELRAVAASLQEQLINLEAARYVRVDTEGGEYYISSTPDLMQTGYYYVFYVSVSGLNNLVRAINLAMALILALAMGVCFVIAERIGRSVTKPVNKLTDFAEAIGKGDFTKNEFSFKDLEFNELGEAMNQSAEKLDLYDKDQRAFFQNVSHELRTPLMSIRCNAEGLACGLMEPRISGETIIQETDRLSEMVEDLLYISRVDSMTAQPEMQEYDLRETLSLCVEDLKALAARSGISFSYEFDDLPVLFLYNEKHMHRAFSNLITNALRYAKNTIVLSCHKTAKQIEISVTDDGEGIAPDDLPHIFERFYMGNDGKHGIGLSIVKSAVELHGGQVSTSNEKGTRFTIFFPA